MGKVILSNKEITEKDYFNKIAKNYDLNYNYSDPFTKYKINKKASSNTPMQSIATGLR